MADKKYRATAVPLKAEQTALLQQAMTIASNKLGVDLSRSQMISLLCRQYIDANAPQEAVCANT
jgi:hypothetical protein